MKMICDSPSTLDRLSDLPSNIIDNILVLLPLHDAARTSVLSKNWKFKWLYRPQFVFGQFHNMEGSLLNPLLSTNEFIMLVYQILLLHQGPLNSFHLSVRHLESCPNITHILHFLHRKGIHEFSFRARNGSLYELPSPIFSCSQLQKLNLSDCTFRPPPEFKWFSMLKDLSLHDVGIAEDAINGFLTKCPLLKKLSLDNYSCHVNQLVVDAPNLTHLTYFGTFNSICFRNAPLLSNVEIENCNRVVIKYDGWETANIVKVLGSLPAISYLMFGHSFSMFLAGGKYIPEQLPTALNNLTYLYLQNFCLNSMKEVECAFCLIRSSPNLQKLYFLLYLNYEDAPGNESTLRYLKAQEQSLNHLKEVRMHFFKGTMHELELIRFLLAKSVALETFVIELLEDVDATALQVLQEGTGFRPASTNARIIFMDPQQ